MVEVSLPCPGEASGVWLSNGAVTLLAVGHDDDGTGSIVFASKDDALDFCVSLYNAIDALKK